MSPGAERASFSLGMIKTEGHVAVAVRMVITPSQSCTCIIQLISFVIFHTVIARSFQVIMLTVIQLLLGLSSNVVLSCS